MTKDSAARLDRADRQASDRLNGKRDSWWMRAIGAASDIGDQPQLRVLCAAVILAGVLRQDRKLAVTGAQMLAAHTVATWGKGRIKAVVGRTRPNSRQGGYRFGRGDSDAPLAARTAAGAVAGVQVARGEHFIGDVLAGSLIGIVAEQATGALVTSGRPAPQREGSAPFTVAIAPAAAGRTAPSSR